MQHDIPTILEQIHYPAWKTLVTFQISAFVAFIAVLVPNMSNIEKYIKW